ncbi:hypothetical protein EIP91_011363 [Steccherinum ochraceum]|uniref:Uncharacterized protein n=1 Tax=Steccherinum ochraceum TaxID=92696 RepID=A0A4R0RII3_9APHY|nr:hypothetical protein EIP91_011363 [Steccherinum ochraceum]
MNRANMSWRKPVPQFVPSRPSSFISLSSGFTPFATVGTRSKPHPPLPKDWRSAIEKALAVDPHDVNANDVECDIMSDDSHETAVEEVTQVLSDVKKESDDEKEVRTKVVMEVPEPPHLRIIPHGGTSIFSHDSASTAHSQFTKRSHQQYSPPTPPAASHTRLPRIDIFNEHDHISFSNVVYPDLPPPSTAPTPSLLNANIYPVTFDPTATTTATMTALGSRDDFHSQYNHDMTGAPKVILPSRKVLASRNRQPTLWSQAWLQVKTWGGALKLSIVRIFGFTRTPGAVTY